MAADFLHKRAPRQHWLVHTYAESLRPQHDVKITLLWLLAFCISVLLCSTGWEGETEDDCAQRALASTAVFLDLDHPDVFLVARAA